MAQQRINPYKAPIVWSTVDEAFQKINANFTELYLSIGGAGVDLTNLASSLIPDGESGRNLGSQSKPWQTLYLGPNSLYIGTAHITASPDGAVNLPPNSTIDGQLIKDPENKGFKTISINGQPAITANIVQGNLNLIGQGLTITSDDVNDSLIFSNTGVTSVAGGTGVSVTGIGGQLTVSNTGVTEISADSGISVTQSTGSITIKNTGVLDIIAGSGILLDKTGGEITITNSAPNVAQTMYKTISVAGQLTLSPATPNSTLTIVNGSGISVATDNITNSLTFTNTGVTALSGTGGITASAETGSVVLSLNSNLQVNVTGHLVGSVFSDSSTMLVDGTNGILVGDLYNSSISTATITGNSTTLQLNSQNSVSQIKIPNASPLSIESNNGVEIANLAASGNISLGNGTNLIEITTGSKLVVDVGNLSITGGLTGQVLSTDGDGNHTWVSAATVVGAGGGSFTFKIAGEDSTQRLINNGETIQFVGSNGIAASCDPEGIVTISGAGISGQQSRQSLSGTTISLATGATGDLTIVGYKSYALYKIQTSGAAWVRVYSSVAARTADSSRTEGVDPLPGLGVIAEVITTGAETVLITPGVFGFNDEATPTTNIELAVTNKTGSTSSITVTLTAVRLEV